MSDQKRTPPQDPDTGRFIGGPPVLYEMGDFVPEILRRVAEGESLRSVCRTEGFPSVGVVLAWVHKDEVLAEQYARAMQSRADAMFDELFDIADDATNDWMERDGSDQLNGENIQRSKLRIDTRKWALARMSPKKYGDKQILEHGGTDGGPIQVSSTVDKAKALAFILEEAARTKT